MNEPNKTPVDDAPDVQLWQHWRQGRRPDVAEFLAGFPDLEATEVVAVLLIDQYQRWQLGERIPAENYLRRFPTLEAKTEAVVELAYGEFLLREERGDRPALDEYLWRFPEHAPRLRQQVQLHLLLDNKTPTSLQDAGEVSPVEQITLVRAPVETTGLPTVPGYEILEVLGRGGMGVVYKARQVMANRVVALKMLLAGGHAGAVEMDRFRTEAEAIARLQHPNIVQVFEVGEHAGLPFFSLEFCAGGSLDRKLAGTPLPPHQAAELVEQLALAMQAAHAANVIHRDLKPANILLSFSRDAQSSERSAGANMQGPRHAIVEAPALRSEDSASRLNDWVPKISDFGLAKCLDDVGVTASGAIMGTPSYMAPEQAGYKPDAQTRSIGPAADVYSLGAILYECLTGRPPFKGATTPETIRQVIDEQPVPPRQLQTKTPRDLETICLKCLRKEPERRYGSAQELADDLRRWLAGEPIMARPVGRLERGFRWCRRNPAVAGLLAAVALSLLLGTVMSSMFAVRARTNEVRAEQEKLTADVQREETTQNLYFAEMALAAQAAESAGGARRLNNLLERWRPVGDKVDRRGWEWYFLRGIVDQSSVLICSRGGGVRAVCWSADSRCLASADASRTIRIWDSHTGRPLAALPAAIGDLRVLSWSPDSRYLAASGDDPPKIQVWDMETRTEAALLAGHGGRVLCLDWSPDSQRLASSSRDGTVKVWEAKTFRELKHLDMGRPATTVAWSPEGERLAVGNKDGLHLFDTQTWKRLGPFPFESIHLAWSPNGKRLASADTLSTRIWNVAQQKLVSTILGQGFTPYGVSWWPRGRIIAGKSRIAVARYNSTVEIHDIVAKSSFLLRGHEGTVQCVSWSPDGRLATGSVDRTIRIWNVAGDTNPLARRAGYSPQSVSWSPDGQRLVISDYAGSAHLLERATGWSAADMAAHQGKPNDRGRDATPMRPVFCWSPDGRYLAASSTPDGLIQLCDPTTRKVKTVLGSHGAFLNVMAWSPDGRRLASGGNNQKLNVWDVESRKVVATLPWGNRFAQGGIVWSPDGRWLAAVQQGPRALIWDAATFQERVTLTGQRMLYALAWSPDSRHLAAAGVSQVIKVWDAEDGKELASLDGHMGTVADLDWSPDGRRLASAAWDRTIKLWDVRKGKEIISLHAHGPNNLDCVRWSPDGRSLASGGADGRIRIWDATPGYLAERSPALLPMLEEKLRAHSDSAADLRLRAKILTRQGAWQAAAADWTKASQRDKNADSSCFEAGWWVRGPFPTAEAPDEDRTDLDPTRPLPEGTARSLIWQAVSPSANRCLDLRRMFFEQRTGSVQVLVRLYSPRQQQVTLLLGSLGSLRAWLNGQRILSRDEDPPGRRAADEKVPLELEAGWNTLLMRVGLGTGPDHLFLELAATVQ